LSLNTTETIHKELPNARNWPKLLDSLFAPLNNDISAQDRCRELKI
jgi:hypothetical protein